MITMTIESRTFINFLPVFTYRSSEFQFQRTALPAANKLNSERSKYYSISIGFESSHIPCQDCALNGSCREGQVRLSPPWPRAQSMDDLLSPAFLLTAPGRISILLHVPVVRSPAALRRNPVNDLV